MELELRHRRELKKEGKDVPPSPVKTIKKKVDTTTAFAATAIHSNSNTVSNHPPNGKLRLKALHAYT